MTALRELADRLDVLVHAVTEARWSEFSMRVPAEPSRDADLVLSQAAIELRAYAAILDAERIEADESAVPFGYLIKNAPPYVGVPMVWRFEPEERYAKDAEQSMPVFTHPPAQSAQSVDVEKVREVIAELSLSDWPVLMEAVKKLTAALQEKGK